jgi:type IV pilus assembly protein PilY1
MAAETAAVYKPVGVLQRHGESNGMYFGLVTGSYGNHLSGGVLRKNIRSITDEINLDTGQFRYKTDSSVQGIIKTIDNFRVIGFNHRIPNGGGNGYWDATIYSGPISEGQNYMWGNPVAEMMYETLRYFAGADRTPAFSSSVSNGNDRGLDLPMETWVDPYTVFPDCSKPIMLLISDINPSYDSDHLPGSYFGGASLSFGDFNARTEANLISTVEGIGGKEYYVGQSGDYTDTSCSAKSVTGFGEIRGLCPEEPTKMGSYYSAAVAHYGARTSLNPLSDQKVSTYTVALASPLPKIEIAMDGGDLITLIPFAKTVYSTGGGGVSPDRGRFQPTCAIIDFYVESITPTSGKFRVTYEHAEQGSDFDMDALITYEYTKTAENTLEVTISSLETTWGGGSKQHFGYIISGTTADGVYLEIKNATQPNNEDRDYYLDTPGSCGPNQGVHDMCWKNNTYLPNIKTRIFSAGSDSAATLLKNPLYYAAKWGGFNDENDNDIPDLQSEWDKTGDGVPDTYFYVANPLKLEEQLNKTFADILARTSSGTAASVVSSSRSGEGAIYQSVFYPELRDAHANTIRWAGQVHALLVDAYGNMREDTNGNKKLDLDEDLFIVFDGETILKYKDINADGIFDDEDIAAGPVSDPKTNYSLNEINFLWSSSDWLNAVSNPVNQRAMHRPISSATSLPLCLPTATWCPCPARRRLLSPRAIHLGRK